MGNRKQSIKSEDKSLKIDRKPRPCTSERSIFLLVSVIKRLQNEDFVIWQAMAERELGCLLCFLIAYNITK